MQRIFARGALLAIGGILLGVLVLASGCTAASQTTTSMSTSTPAPSATNATSTVPTTQEATIGQTVTVGQLWQLTAVNFRLFTPPNRTPAAGMKYVAMEVNVKNISSSDQPLAAAESFVIRDAAGQQYQQVYVGGISLALNDVVGAGDTRHGVVAFEVPSGTNAFTVIFTGSMSQPKGEYVHWSVSL
jgi:hypothetical protein